MSELYIEKLVDACRELVGKYCEQARPNEDYLLCAHLAYEEPDALMTLVCPDTEQRYAFCEAVRVVNQLYRSDYTMLMMPAWYRRGSDKVSAFAAERKEGIFCNIEDPSGSVKSFCYQLKRIDGLPKIADFHEYPPGGSMEGNMCGLYREPSMAVPEFVRKLLQNQVNQFKERCSHGVH